jgi:hypothetical protein
MLKLTGVDARRGPSLEADWPCILLRFEGSVQTLHDPAPGRVIEDIARDFEGDGGISRAPAQAASQARR